MAIDQKLLLEYLKVTLTFPCVILLILIIAVIYFRKEIAFFKEYIPTFIRSIRKATYGDMSLELAASISKIDEDISQRKQTVEALPNTQDPTAEILKETVFNLLDEMGTIRKNQLFREPIDKKEDIASLRELVGNKMGIYLDVADSHIKDMPVAETFATDAIFLRLIFRYPDLLDKYGFNSLRVAIDAVAEEQRQRDSNYAIKSSSPNLSKMTIARGYFGLTVREWIKNDTTLGDSSKKVDELLRLCEQANPTAYKMLGDAAQECISTLFFRINAARLTK